MKYLKKKSLKRKTLKKRQNKRKTKRRVQKKKRIFRKEGRSARTRGGVNTRTGCIPSCTRRVVVEKR